MFSRFIDKRHIIEKESGFIKRTHGIKIYWFILASLTITGILSLPPLLYFDYPKNYLVTGFNVFLLMGLTYFIYKIISKDRHFHDLLELQNALFAGAARQSSEFCVILKYDGSVVYVDPSYNARYYQLKYQGYSDFDALCESGNLSQAAKISLQEMLKDGKSGQITFTVPNLGTLNQTNALMIDPIGIYEKQTLDRTLNLAISPITRPSGYFFLRARRVTIEDEYQECLSAFNFGYISLDQDNQILSANEVFADMIGHDYNDIIHNMVPFESLFFEEDRPYIFDQNENFQTTLSIITKSSQAQHVVLSQIVNEDSQHKSPVRHILIHPIQSHNSLTATDNADKNTLSNKLLILDHSSLPTIILKDNGDITESNALFSHFISQNFGNKSLKKYISLFDIITPQNVEIVSETLQSFQSSDKDHHEPVDLYFKDSKQHIATLYLKPILDENKHSTPSFIGHLVDTTELKNLESHLAHSQKMQAVGQLAGGIAHDFNNLLTAMIGFCDLLLLKHPAGDQSFPEIMQIKQNANRAANLVKQLLAFSRKQTLQPEIINVTDTLADLSDLIRRLIGEQMTLKMQHGRDLKKVKVDQGQLEQVIINLAVNARDAMPKGGELTIKTSNISIKPNTPNITNNLISPTPNEAIEAGDYVLIEVSDTGTGISDDLLKKIFEPFFSTKDIGAGTGLGLSTVYGIIKQTNGYLFVSSTLNQGTHFYIFFKQCHDVKTVKKPKDDIKDIETSDKPIDLTGRGTILIVEDETPVRIFSCNALKNKGYTILEADCAETALEIVSAKGKDIDAIISDVMMPGMNGPDMIKEVYKTYPAIKVIFVSGYGEDEFIKTFGEDRNFNFLSKPYSLKQLSLKLKQVLEKV